MYVLYFCHFIFRLLKVALLSQQAIHVYTGQVLQPRSSAGVNSFPSALPAEYVVKV